MQFRRILLLALLIGYLFPAHANKPLAPTHIPNATNLTVEQTVKLILSTPDLVIIDSRKQEEYNAGHIEGAVSLLNTEMTENSLRELLPDKGSPVLFYCNGIRCMRSSDAAIRATEWGYHSVYWFRGGWQEWTEKQMPIEK